MFVAFYDNEGKGLVVPVDFKSEQQADDFIKDYEYLGGFKRFNYDFYGMDKRGFINWLDKNYPLDNPNISRSSEIVNYTGANLFKYIMSMFGRRI